MRKQDKVIIWPVYFDANKTRLEGRRVPKNIAVPSPKITEIEEAATKLRIENELVPDKGYPKSPWHRPGMLLSEKKDSKEQVLKQIAKQILKDRNEAFKQQ